jgi:hypothetical protein
MMKNVELVNFKDIYKEMCKLSMQVQRDYFEMTLRPYLQ